MKSSKIILPVLLAAAMFGTTAYTAQAAGMMDGKMGMMEGGDMGCGMMGGMMGGMKHGDMGGMKHDGMGDMKHDGMGQAPAAADQAPAGHEGHKQ